MHQQCTAGCANAGSPCLFLLRYTHRAVPQVLRQRAPFPLPRRRIQALVQAAARHLLGSTCCPSRTGRGCPSPRVAQNHPSIPGCTGTRRSKAPCTACRRGPWSSRSVPRGMGRNASPPCPPTALQRQPRLAQFDESRRCPAFLARRCQARKSLSSGYVLGRWTVAPSGTQCTWRNPAR